jgi:hypothetical protein
MEFHKTNCQCQLLPLETTPHVELTEYCLNSPVQIDRFPKNGSLTYCGPHMQSISNLFKRTNLHITLCTTNTICNILTPRAQHNKIDYENSGIQSLLCRIPFSLCGTNQTKPQTMLFLAYVLHLTYNTQSAYVRRILQHTL